AMTVRSSIALEGSFIRFNFQGPGGTVYTEAFSLLYARRITGRSSIEFGGGPEVTQANLSQASQQQYLDWQARAGARYSVHNVVLNAEASRTVSGGAGVLSG